MPLDELMWPSCPTPILGMPQSAAGILKSEVSRICADLDIEVAAFRDRSLAGTSYPYMFLENPPSERR